MIERSVRRVLASSDVQLEVIVIDDGSKRPHQRGRREAFAGEPRVRLITLENGGKARALNHGAGAGHGDIVIALDADTQFEPTTIARLARWFADPRLGAVAGNAKVGNRVNLVTRWQALEYITAQNLERRALGRLDAMTVVPGAVGAWRRRRSLDRSAAIPHDTLAEDQDLTIAIQRAGWRVALRPDARRLDRSAGELRGARQAALPLGVRHAAMPVEARRRHGRGQAARACAASACRRRSCSRSCFAAISPIIDLALILTSSARSPRSTSMATPRAGRPVTDVAYSGCSSPRSTSCRRSSPSRWNGARTGACMAADPQRFGYRQIMYYVVIKAVVQALRGPRVGWSYRSRDQGKLQSALLYVDAIKRLPCMVSGTLPRLAFQIDTDMSAHRTRGNPQKTGQLRDMHNGHAGLAARRVAADARAGWILL